MTESDSGRLLQKKVQELQALLDFGRAIAGLASPEEIVRRLGLTVAGQWALRAYGIVLRREGRPLVVRQRGLAPLPDGSLPLAGAAGVLPEIGIEPFRLPGSRSPVLAALAALADLASAGVCAVVPFVSGETPCGLLALGPRPGGIPWEDDDLAYASGLATQALVSLEAAWQREDALEWKRLGEAREEWRRLDTVTGLVFSAVARLGARESRTGGALLDAVAGLLADAGLSVDQRQLGVAVERLVVLGALERVAGGGLELRRPDWLLLPEVRAPLAELVRSVRRKVGGYELLERIGSGGMAEVFRARSLADQSEAAVKLISESLSDDADMRERFEREGEIVSRLSHPHIVRLLARGEHEGRLFLAMELLPGEPLSHAVRTAPFPLGEALRALRQLASALAVLHAAGVLHRDVKSSNVMRLPGGDVVLLDFGLARDFDSRSVTRSGEIVGTVAYLAPEVIAGSPATAASDLWALGILFVEMLLGHWPWQAAAGVPLAVEVLRARPRIPEEVAEAGGGTVRRLTDILLAEDPARRPADGAALVRLLDDVPSVEGSPSFPPTRGPFPEDEETTVVEPIPKSPGSGGA